MGQTYLLGIDIGTSGAKAGIFDQDGKLVSLRQEEYHFSHPNPGWSELDPLMVWGKVQGVVRECVAQSGLEPTQVRAIGLSVLGETAMPLDRGGNPVYPAIEAMDRRGNAYQQYVEWFDQTFGAGEIFQRTSYPLSSLPPALKILWLRDNQPEVFEKIYKFATFQDFTVWRLTGSPSIDYSMASRTMLFDVQEKTWISDYLQAMGITEGFLSPAFVSSHPAGELSEQVADLLGLSPGTIVVPGAHDQSCAALGIGVVRPGLAGDGTGSVEAIVTATNTPVRSKDMLARGQGSQCHIQADSYLALGFHLSAGSLVRWYRDQLGHWEQATARESGKDPYDLITRAASQSPPGAKGLLVLPHWSGAGTGRIPALNPSSRGAILGMTLGHSKADLSRAIFEGITFEARYIIDSLESSGINILELVVTGGGAKSDFWLQLKADITGKQIVVPRVTEASLLGAAMLAGVGVGVYTDVESAVEQVCVRQSIFEPDQANHQIYNRIYPIYKDFYQSVIGLSERLSYLQTSA